MSERNTERDPAVERLKVTSPRLEQDEFELTPSGQREGTNSSHIDYRERSTRATAVTNLAYQGVPAPALQSMMGWSKLSTATKYIRLSGTATAEALNKAFDA